VTDPGDPATAAAGNTRGWLGGSGGERALRLQRLVVVLVIGALFVGGALRYGSNFYAGFNVTEFLRNNAYFALIALGMTFAIVSGGIDLSVGSVVALAAVVAARLSPHGPGIATAGAVAAGLAVGLFNGAIIGRVRVAPFLVTLVALLAARGLALLAANNANVAVDFRSGFTDLGQRNLGPLPLPAVVVAVAYVVGGVLLNRTRFGAHALAIGGNEEAARLAGLPIGRTLLGVYALSGALAGLAGAILAALTFSGIPTAAVGWELSAIAAAVLGGTLLTGGVGSVSGTLAGVLFVGLVFNVLNFERGRGVFDLNVYWENVIRGALLLAVVIVQSALARPAGERRG
jgi:ribose transport system permease protein